MAKHRIGVVGLGMALKPHALSLKDLADRVEVAAAFAPSRERREQAAKAWGDDGRVSIPPVARLAQLRAAALNKPESANRISVDFEQRSPTSKLPAAAVNSSAFVMLYLSKLRPPTMSIDGVTMNTQRYTQGLTTSFFINPDLVDEMRVVVAPVDVEGRGAAQIQMRGRSGTNQVHGAATWNIRNSALNANTW